MNFFRASTSVTHSVLVASKLDQLVAEYEPEKRKIIVAAFRALANEFTGVLVGMNMRDRSLHASLLTPLLKHLFAGERRPSPNGEVLAANRPVVLFSDHDKRPGELGVHLRTLEATFAKPKLASTALDKKGEPNDVIDAALEKRRTNRRRDDDLIDF